DPTGQDATWHLVADVKLHGVTRKVEFSLDCHQIGGKLQIRGKKMFKLTDFNIQPFSTALGAVKVKNDFEVTYNIILDRIH
ncbi:MAG TPA: YceI family protein, partial [Terriglobia bacterium]|nr:YceI family protein [Terriglobia bacterium]